MTTTQGLRAFASIALFGLLASIGSAQNATIDDPMPFPPETGPALPHSYAPKITERAQLAYPAELKERRWEDTVWIAFLVDPSGAVHAPRAFFSRHSEFEAPAIAAVQQSKFTGGMHDGRAVWTQMVVSVRFTSIVSNP